MNTKTLVSQDNKSLSQNSLPWKAVYPKFGREDTYVTLQALSQESIAVLDTETTGLKKTDQITEIALVDYHTREVLLNTLVCPKNLDAASFEKSKAAKISGLTYDQLRLQPTFQDVFSLVKPLLKSYIIAGWNIEYDAKMLVRSAMPYQLRIPQFTMLDVMKLFQAWSEFSDHHKLEEALNLCNLGKSTNMHRALTDVYSTMNVLQFMEKASREVGMGA